MTDVLYQVSFANPGGNCCHCTVISEPAAAHVPILVQKGRLSPIARSKVRQRYRSHTMRRPLSTYVRFLQAWECELLPFPPCIALSTNSIASAVGRTARNNASARACWTR